MDRTKDRGQVKGNKAARYSANRNLNPKVLDFVKSGGSLETKTRTEKTICKLLDHTLYALQGNKRGKSVEYYGENRDSLRQLVSRAERGQYHAKQA